MFLLATIRYIKNIWNNQYCFFSSNANITFRTRVSADCRDLIQSCLKRSPSSRIPLEKILNHRWVTSTATPCGPLSPNGTPNEGIPPRGPPPQRSLVHARASLLGDFSDLAPLTGEFCFSLWKYYDFVPWVKTLHQLLVHLKQWTRSWSKYFIMSEF